MLFSIEPLANVLSAVSPDIATFPVLFIIQVLALIETSIFPLIDPLPMHVVVEPSSLVVSAIWPLVCTLDYNVNCNQPYISFYPVIDPLACIRASVSPGVGTEAVFLALIVVSIKA